MDVLFAPKFSSWQCFDYRFSCTENQEGNSLTPKSDSEFSLRVGEGRGLVLPEKLCGALLKIGYLIHDRPGFSINTWV